MFGRKKKIEPEVVEYLSPDDARKIMISGHLNALGWAKQKSSEINDNIMREIKAAAERGEGSYEYTFRWSDMHPDARPGPMTRSYVDKYVQMFLSDLKYEYEFNGGFNGIDVKITWYDGVYDAFELN